MKGKGNTKHTLNDKYFENIDTEEKAYWLGFIMADGCVYGQGCSYRFQINVASRDREALEKLNKALGSNYEIRDKDVRGSQVSQLKINSTPLCKSLIRHGVIPRKSGKETMPDLPQELASHFIRGYFDGDGCITHGYKKEGWYRAKLSILGGQKIIEAIIIEIKKLGCSIPPKAIQDKGKTKELNLSSVDTVRKFQDYIYSNATLFLERKRTSLKI